MFKIQLRVQKSLIGVILAILLSVTSGIHAFLAPPPSAIFTDPAGGTGGGPIDGELHVTVVQAGSTTPVNGAFVMAGPAPDDPFPGNYGNAGSDGTIAFNDSNLQGPIHVTAGAPGYQLFTFFDVDANDIVIPLSLISQSSTDFQIGDFVSGVDVDNGTAHYGDNNLDIAFVMPSLSLDMLTTFEMSNLVGPLETIDIMGEQVQVPSNIFIPQQWELFIEINKNHYYLYLPSGDYTLYAMSGRIPRDEMIDIINSGGSFMDILPLMAWREADILDWTVSGASNNADLTVDPDLASAVTLNIANVPADAKAIGISAGDLDNLNGLGRIVPLGFNSLDCPPGSPCSGSIPLTTLPSAGEFSGMGFFPGVAVQANSTNDMLAILRRQSHAQSYSENISDFFGVLNPFFDGQTFFWNDVYNASTGSPQVAVHAGRFTQTDTSDGVWNYSAPASALNVMMPVLPSGAPGGFIEGVAYTWEHSSIGLNFNPQPFDYNAFSFSDITEHLSHVASDSLDFNLALPTQTPSPTSPPPSPTPTTPPGTPTSTAVPASPTPTPPPTFTSTITPTPNPTYGCPELGCTIYMPSMDFAPGDTCLCDVTVCNPTSETFTQNPLFVILDVLGNYYFAPEFDDFSYYSQAIPPGETVISVLPAFEWPDNAGTMEGILWYAALTNPEMSQLFGNMDAFEFGWHS